MMILFGGGDAGGIYIHDGKVDPVPPFNDTVLQHLRTISQLLRSATMAGDAIKKDALNTAVRLSQEVLAGGVIITDGRPASEFAFVDVDGGFWCGSNGKHLIPFPPRKHGPILV